MKPTAPLPKSTSDRLTTVLSYGTLLLLIYLVFRITEPFLVPLAWSAVLAIFFYPLHERIEKRLKPTQAALLSTVLVTIVLIVPAIVVLVLATRQAIDATARIQSALMDPDKELPMHAVAWIRGHLPGEWQHRGPGHAARAARPPPRPSSVAPAEPPLGRRGRDPSEPGRARDRGVHGHALVEQLVLWDLLVVGELRLPVGGAERRDGP